MNPSIGALWKKVGAKGAFLSGKVTINGAVLNIVVFPKTNKTSEKGPDFEIFESIKQSPLVVDPKQADDFIF
jgi:uncharacterized protein (DUF736 family)